MNHSITHIDEINSDSRIAYSMINKLAGNFINKVDKLFGNSYVEKNHGDEKTEISKYHFNDDNEFVLDTLTMDFENHNHVYSTGLGKTETDYYMGMLIELNYGLRFYDKTGKEITNNEIYFRTIIGRTSNSSSGNIVISVYFGYFKVNNRSSDLRTIQLVTTDLGSDFNEHQNDHTFNFKECYTLVNGVFEPLYCRFDFTAVDTLTINNISAINKRYKY
jgi:hypothetical protein